MPAPMKFTNSPVALHRTRTILRHEAQPLVFQVSPQQGESLNSLLARSTARNVYDRVGLVLATAGVAHLRTEAVPMTRIADAETIARVISGPSNDNIAAIRSLFHPPVDTRPAGWVDFHGTPIRERYREPARRRLAPGVLAADDMPYCRSLWQLRVFPFDPVTRERLIDRCPVCAQPLGWRKSFGIHLCERCAVEDREHAEIKCVDLRDHPQPIMPCEDIEGLAVATGLIDPDPALRASVRQRISHVFSPFETADLFELLIDFASADTTSPEIDKLERPGPLAEFERYTPDVLARAARVLMNWPNAFHDLCDRVRSHADSRATRKYGVRKELGPVLFITREPALPKAVKEIVAKGVEADMKRTAGSAGRIRRADSAREEGWTSKDEAWRVHGVPWARLDKLARAAKGAGKSALDATAMNIRVTKTGQSPIEFRVEELAAVKAALADKDSRCAIALRFGVPTDIIDRFVERGLIDPIRGLGAGALDPDERFSRASFEALAARIEARIEPCQMPGTAILSLARVAAGTRLAIPDWTAAFAAIADGSLAVMRHPFNDSAFSRRLVVRKGSPELAQLTRLLSAEAIAVPDRDAISGKEAELMLGTSTGILLALREAGFIEQPEPIPNEKRAWRRRQIDAFRDGFALSSEICQRTRWKAPKITLRMAELGFEPIARLGPQKWLVWKRDDAENAVRMADRPPI